VSNQRSRIHLKKQVQVLILGKRLYSSVITCCQHHLTDCLFILADFAIQQTGKNCPDADAGSTDSAKFFSNVIPFCFIHARADIYRFRINQRCNSLLPLTAPQHSEMGAQQAESVHPGSLPEDHFLPWIFLFFSFRIHDHDAAYGKYHRNSIIVKKSCVLSLVFS
jgi:hypothetical protein